MATPTSPSRSIRPVWAATLLLPLGAQLVAALGLSSLVTFSSPEMLMFAATLFGSICVATSTAMVRRAFRTNEAELACLGTFFYAVSVLFVVSGVMTPDVLAGPNTASNAALLLTVPVGLAAVAPFLARRSDAAGWLRRHWQTWIATAMAATTALSLALLLAPNAMPRIEARTPAVIVIALASVFGCAVMAHRHLTLARIAQRHSPLVVSFGFGTVGASSLVWLAATPFDTGFWVGHALVVVGVLVGTVGASAVYRRSATMEQVVGPVVLTEPLTALAVGLDPIVHQFIADLDAKDPSTRDHVIRTTELAVRVGEEMRLGAMQLRDLGLAAILHDIGKVGVPTEILTKAGRLTPGEFEIMQAHVEIGARMIEASPVLASIAPAVRGHHERMDGRGYPDGLVGQEISQNARIIAVCDAYDAMANSRLYRAGMGHDKAVAILREHSGSQWDPVAVEALVMTLARHPMTEELHIQIDRIGRDIELSNRTSGYIDCLPDEALAELELHERALAALEA